MSELTGEDVKVAASVGHALQWHSVKQAHRTPLHTAHRHNELSRFYSGNREVCGISCTLNVFIIPG